MPSAPTRRSTAGEAVDALVKTDDVNQTKRPSSRDRKRQGSGSRERRRQRSQERKGESHGKGKGKETEKNQERGGENLGKGKGRETERSQEKNRQNSREKRRPNSRERKRQNSQEKKQESAQEGERQSSQERDRPSSQEGERQSSGERKSSRERKRRSSRERKRENSQERKGKGQGEKGKGAFDKGKGKGRGNGNYPVCNGNAALISKMKRISAEDPLLDGRRLRGFVKHYCPLVGFGLVRCDEHKLEVILNRDEGDKGDVTSGATVSFSLDRDEDCKPLARQVRVLLKGTVMRHRVQRLQGVEIDWSKTYVGTVKVTWSGGKDSIFVVPSMQKKDTGGAFIGSDEAFKVFGDDIWAYPCRIPGGLKAGDMLKFKVEIDHFWSYPVAVNIQRVEPMVKDSSKDPEVPNAAKSSQEVTPGERASSRERSDSRTRKANKQPKPKPVDTDNDQKADTDKGCVPDVVATLPTPNRTSVQKGESEELVDTFGALPERERRAEIQRALDNPCLDVDEEPNPQDSSNPQDSLHPTDDHASIWQRYQMEGGQSYWWWCELDNDCFLEANPGPWTRYMDPDSGRHYWWKSEDKWFWIPDQFMSQ